MLLSKLKMSTVTIILMIAIIGIESKYIPRHNKPGATRVARDSNPKTTPVDAGTTANQETPEEPGKYMWLGPTGAPISARKVDDAADDVNRLTDSMGNVVENNEGKLMEEEPKVTVLSSPTAEKSKQEDVAVPPVAAEPSVAVALPVDAVLPAAADPPVVAALPAAAVPPVVAALPVAAEPPAAAELPVISDVEVVSSSNNNPSEEAISVQINSYNDAVPVSDTRLPEGPVKPGFSAVRPLRMFGGFMRDAWKMYKSYVFGYMPHMLSGK